MLKFALNTNREWIQAVSLVSRAQDWGPITDLVLPFNQLCGHEQIIALPSFSFPVY